MTFDINPEPVDLFREVGRLSRIASTAPYKYDPKAPPAEYSINFMYNPHADKFKIAIVLMGDRIEFSEYYEDPMAAMKFAKIKLAEMVRACRASLGIK